MYVNLPGSYVQLQDGNFATSPINTDQSVLIIGTATKGLTSEPYRMGDLGSLVREFGSDSELTRVASEVKKGGAANIFVYRLPGVAPSLAKVGADGTPASGTAPEGFTIKTAQESPEAAEKYAIAYRHATNVKTSGTVAAATELAGELIVVNIETEQVVWQGNAITGASVDNGEVDVQFDLGDISATVTGPESVTLSGFGNLAGGNPTGGADPGTGTTKVTVPFSGVDVTFDAAVSGVTEAAAFVTAFDKTALAGVFTATADGSGGVVITANKTVNADGELVYGSYTYTPAGGTATTVTHPWAGYTARPFVSGTTYKVLTPNTGTASTVVVAVAAASGAHNLSRAFDIGLYPQVGTAPFATAGGAVLVRLDKVAAGVTSASTSIFTYNPSIVSFAHISAAAKATANGLGTTRIAFTAGSTGASISAMKRYEKLHTAYENLDLAAFDYIVPANAIVDAKNVADGHSLSISAGAYPAPAGANDTLGYLAVYENGDYTYTYYWSVTGTGLPVISSDGVLPTSGSFSYAAVNFAHLTALYCYENSTDYRSCMAVIGASLPTSFSSRGIREYFGKAPTYSLNRETGDYYVAQETDNGAGLLGHKLIGGNTGFNDGVKHGGLFLTKDKTMSYVGTNLEYDANGKKVDLGKYLVVVGIFGTTPDDLNLRRAPYMVNAAPMIAGMLPQILPIDSLINMAVPGLTIPYRLETKLVDVGIGLGLVLAKSESGQPSIADSPTFASPGSDYTRLTTVRIVSKLSEELRAAAKPFLGKGLSGPKRNALEGAIGEVLKLNLGETVGVQTITSGRFKVSQSAADRVLGRIRVDLTVTPVFELRQITFSVNLSV